MTTASTSDHDADDDSATTAAGSRDGDSAGAATGRASGRDGAQRRQDMLVVARRLFLAHGFHDTTTRMIAKESGVSDALLYRYFPSKRDLFDAVIDDGLSHFEPYLRYGAPLLANLRLRETLEAVAYTTVELIRRDREVFQLILSESHLLEGDMRVREVIAGLFTHFTLRLEDFVASGEARACDTRIFARQFIGGIAMFDLFELTFPGDGPTPGDGTAVPIAHYVDEVVDAALRALAPAPS